VGQVYPKGIPVGRVIEIMASPSNPRVVSAVVKPLADLQHLEFVTVARLSGLR
jgi:cell shape-determining protein MreC